MLYADARCTYTEAFTPEHTYTYTGPCVITGKPYSVTVPGAGLFRYRRGAHIQDAFPDLTPDDREFLISGIAPGSWDETLPAEGDDDGDNDSEGQGSGANLHGRDESRA